MAQDQFRPEGADFLGVMGRVLLQGAQDQMRLQSIDTS
jgi:hypothetical protein